MKVEACQIRRDLLLVEGIHDDDVRGVQVPQRLRALDPLAGPGQVQAVLPLVQIDRTRDDAARVGDVEESDAARPTAPQGPALTATGGTRQTLAPTADPPP